MKKYLIFSLSCLVLVSMFSCKTKQVAVVEKKTEVAPVTSEVYFPKVKAIVAKSCVNCHNSGYGVILNTDELIAKHAANIKSEVVAHKMPKKGTISEEEIQMIVNWAKKGGKITD